MIRIRYALFALGVGVLFGVGLTLLVSSSSRPDPVLVRKAKALDQFCRHTRGMLDADIVTLETGSTTTGATDSHTMGAIFRESAAEKIFSGDEYTSVYACVGDETPKTSDALKCFVGAQGQRPFEPKEYGLYRDYACVAKQARAYRDALVARGFGP